MQVPRLNLSNNNSSSATPGFQRLDTQRSTFSDSLVFGVPLSARRSTASSVVGGQHSARVPYVQSKAMRPSSAAAAAAPPLSSSSARGSGRALRTTPNRTSSAASRAPRGAASVVSFVASQQQHHTSRTTPNNNNNNNNNNSPRSGSVTSQFTTATTTSSMDRAAMCSVEELNAIDSITVGDKFGSLRLVDAVLLEHHQSSASVVRSGSMATEDTSVNTSPAAAASSAAQGRSGSEATTVVAAGAEQSHAAAALGMTRAEIAALKPAAVITFSGGDTSWADAGGGDDDGASDAGKAAERDSDAGGLTIRVLSRYSPRPVTLVRFSISELRRLDWVPQHSSLIVGSDTGASVTIRCSSNSGQSAHKLAMLYKFLHARCRGVFPSKATMSVQMQTVAASPSRLSSRASLPHHHHHQHNNMNFPPLSARSNCSDAAVPRPRSSSPPVAVSASHRGGVKLNNVPSFSSIQPQNSKRSGSEMAMLAPRAARKDLLIKELLGSPEQPPSASAPDPVPAPAPVVDVPEPIAPTTAATKRRSSLPHVIVEDGWTPEKRRSSRSSTPVDQQ